MLSDGKSADRRGLFHAAALSHAPALLAFVLLTVVQTWPLVLNPGAWVPHDLGDPLLSTWALWWNAIHVPFTDRWWNGDIFYPAPGALALSDHRVGLGLFTTPLILLGASPVAAHNVAFLLSYVLSAAFAYALAFVLTRHRGGAFVAGLVYGFHPFRAEHLPHLELLSSYWLPAVLVSLHRWRDTLARRWLVAVAVSLILVAFTTGYYFFFLGVLIGLWLIWFLPRDLPLRTYLELGVALLIPFVPLAPVLVRYRDVHTLLGLSRTITEIELLSADVRGLLATPEALAFWNAPDAWRTPEGALFPGVTAVLLVMIAMVAWARSGGPPERRVLVRRILLGIGAVAAGVALLPVLWGPVRLALGPLRLTVTEAYKPFSIAVVMLTAWGLSAPVMRAAWRAHAPLPFYALATVAMWIFAFGPTARLLGERVFYKAPYSWLMLLPGFSTGFRAPARFAMLAALTLSAAAALAVVWLTRRTSPRGTAAVTALVAVGVLVDGWVAPFPLPPTPAPLTMPAGIPQSAAIMELPSDVFEDALAMYHATLHRRPIVNGLSGYQAPHQNIVRSAIREGDVTVLESLADDRPLAVFLAKGTAATALKPALQSRPRVTTLESTPQHDVFVVSAMPRPRTAIPDPSLSVPIAALSATNSTEILQQAFDGDSRTSWVTDGPQTGSELVTVMLQQAETIGGIVLGLGAFNAGFPRELVIEVSEDGQSWATVFRGPTALPSLAAALDDPPHLRVPFSFAPVRARLVRLRQTRRAIDDAWAIAEVVVVRGQ